MDIVPKFPIYIPTLLFLIPFAWALLSWFSKTKGWWMGGIFGGIGAFLIGQTIWALILGAVLGLAIDYALSTIFFKKIGF